MNGGDVSWPSGRGVSRNSLSYWIEQDLGQACKERGGWRRWIVWADATEVERLQAYRDRNIAQAATKLVRRSGWIACTSCARPD